MSQNMRRGWEIRDHKSSLRWVFLLSRIVMATNLCLAHSLSAMMTGGLCLGRKGPSTIRFSIYNTLKSPEY